MAARINDSDSLRFFEKIVTMYGPVESKIRSKYVVLDKIRESFFLVVRKFLRQSQDPLPYSDLPRRRIVFLASERLLSHEEHLDEGHLLSLKELERSIRRYTKSSFFSDFKREIEDSDVETAIDEECVLVKRESFFSRIIVKEDNVSIIPFYGILEFSHVELNGWGDPFLRNGKILISLNEFAEDFSSYLEPLLVDSGDEDPINPSTFSEVEKIKSYEVCKRVNKLILEGDNLKNYRWIDYFYYFFLSENLTGIKGSLKKMEEILEPGRFVPE